MREDEGEKSTFMAPALDLLSALVPFSGASPGRAALTMPRPLLGEISRTGCPSGGSSLHGASQDHILRIMFWMSAGTGAAHTASAWWRSPGTDTMISPTHCTIVHDSYTAIPPRCGDREPQSCEPHLRRWCHWMSSQSLQPLGWAGHLPDRGALPPVQTPAQSAFLSCGMLARSEPMPTHVPATDSSSSPPQELPLAQRSHTCSTCPLHIVRRAVWRLKHAWITADSGDRSAGRSVQSYACRERPQALRACTCMNLW